jgi:signal transduction histidine kinase
MNAHRYVTGALSLRTRVYLLMAIGVVFPVGLMAISAIFWARELDERLIQGRTAAASAVAGHFDEELTSDLENLQRLASAVSSGFDDPDREGVRRTVRSVHELFHHRETIFLLDRAQNVVAVEPLGAISEVPVAAKPLVEEVMATGRPRLSGLVAEPRGLSIHELVPVRSWRGEVVGVVGGTFRPEAREFDKMLAHLRRGQTGFADLVDAQGHVIASTRRERVGRETECGGAALATLVASRQPFTQRCVACHIERGVSVPDPKEILTAAPLSAAPWAVMVRQDAAEALPTLGAVPWYAVLLGLLVQFVLVGIFAWGAAESVTRPVAVLRTEAERIAGGELASPIPPLGGDEVGRLGKALDEMRVNLKEMIEHVAHVNDELEGRVEERTHALNEANAALREREEDRSQLLRKVITAQEDERKRIARELHDETTQSLAVLAMGLEAAQDAIRSGMTPRLDEVKAVAVRTLEDVHRLILDLRPSVLDDLGLLSAIRWYAERQLESRGLSVRCEFGELDRRLPPELETALFRMCQETMSNIARHAQATAVLVQVGVEDGELRIEIEDDGKGFDPETVAKREGRRPWGLLGIRERAEILGGTARIDSAPGKGTRVLVRIPLPKEKREKDQENDREVAASS